MHVVYLNGKRLHLTWHELQGQFRHPLFVGMMLVMAALIVVIGPYDHLLHFGALQLSLFYAAAFGSFTAFLFFALYLCHRQGWLAYSLVTVGIAGLGASFCGLGMALFLGAPMPAAQDLALVIGFNMVFSYLGEIVHATFLMPRILADLRGKEGTDLTPSAMSKSGQAQPAMPPPTLVQRPEAQVVLFGQSFVASSIRMIEAEEHYVGISLHDGQRVLLRGRIADAVALMPSHLGRQVHRSTWVARVAVSEFRQESSGACLLLRDGRRVSVARQRIAEVRAWVGVATEGSGTKKAPKGVPSLPR